jgi:hypothetical protein
LIATLCEEILRVVATIKLKKARASQLCKRLNTYSRQHPLCQALKEFGKLRKPEFPLHFIDDVTLRQAVEIQFDKGEHANKFSKAVSFSTITNSCTGSTISPMRNLWIPLRYAFTRLCHFQPRRVSGRRSPQTYTGRSAPDVYDTFGTFLGIYPLLTSVIVCLYNLDGFFRKSIRIPVCAGQGAVPFLQAPDLQPIVHADDDDLIVDACQLS